MNYVTQIYCEHAGCNVRQCEIFTKELDGPDVNQWRCPACGSPAKVHWRRDIFEYRRIDLENSLGAVNAALHQRDGDGVFPAGALLLSKLPDAWKPVAPEMEKAQ